MLMYNYRFISVLLIILFGSCRGNVSTHATPETMDSVLYELMQEAVDNSYDHIPGISMSIRSPKLKSEYSGVFGYDGVKKQNRLTSDQPFRIASVTKTFVATSILRLHEEGKLSIYDPISKYISSEHLTMLSADTYNPDKILIYHCLNHTSGLFDYAMNGSDYASMARKNPQRRWTRTQQLQLAMVFGDPVGFPGEKYLYSDTGYILLGEIIESFYEGDLAKGIRELVGFQNIGLTQTWLESLEKEPANMKSQVKRYLGNEAAEGFDPSIDLYGGGGLVSTCDDLSKFMDALFNHKIYKNKSTLELMLQQHEFNSTYVPEKDRRFKDYRLGLWKVTLYGENAYMHQGLWGTTILHIPKQNLTLSINYTRGWSNRLLKKVVLLINNLEVDAE